MTSPPTSPTTPKSAPVLLPGVKKPTLLQRLFSTERKSSLYVVSPEDDVNASSDGASEQRRQHRHAQRLKSVDSATMQRDRDALFQQQRQRSQHVKSSDKTSVSKGSKVTGIVSSVEPPVTTFRQPVRPNSAAASSSHRKQSLTPTDSKTQRLVSQPQLPASLTLGVETSSGGYPDEPLPLLPKSDDISQSHAISSGQRKQSLTSLTKRQTSSGSKPASSPETENKEPFSHVSTPESPCAEASNTKNKLDTEPKKRMSISKPGNGQPLVTKPSSSKGRKGYRNLKRRKQRNASASIDNEIKVDTSKPLEYPATPDMISEYHRQKPFLNHNEEWIIVELLQYECLVDGMEIIRIIAKHSKFFEVEPDELWEEFFEFVENVPSYDEIINYDVWQEFLLEKYNC